MNSLTRVRASTSLQCCPVSPVPVLNSNPMEHSQNIDISFMQIHGLYKYAFFDKTRLVSYNYFLSLSPPLFLVVMVLLKLYGAPMSTCTARVMTCLHGKGVDFELNRLDLFTGEHKQPPFLSKNPFGQIPVLEDDDLTLFESRAITAYVAEKFKDTGSDLIRQQDLKEAAMVKVWTEVESQQFHPAIAPIVYEFFVAPIRGESPDQSAIDANLEKLRKVLDVYESKLSSSKYLAGDFYSLADLHHLPYTYYFMKTPCASAIEERPHVKAWWDDISSRPAFVKVAEGMNFGAKNE